MTLNKSCPGFLQRVTQVKQGHEIQRCPVFLQYLTPSETRTLNKEVSGVSAERFTKVLVEQQQDRARREQERIRLLTADPLDLDAQAKIEEDIT